uniref:hypothetical protein n=1 Tax=Shewanella sp. TaxID=50422 RepID=UPI004048B408
MNTMTTNDLKEIVKQLQQHPATHIEPINEKDSKRLIKLSDEIMDGVSALVPLVNEVIVDHLLARNDVIIDVMLADYAALLTLYEQHRQRINKLSKQDKRLVEFYAYMIKLPTDYAITQVTTTATRLGINVDVKALWQAYKQHINNLNTD